MDLETMPLALQTQLEAACVDSRIGYYRFPKLLPERRLDIDMITFDLQSQLSLSVPVLQHISLLVWVVRHFLQRSAALLECHVVG